MSEWVWPGRIEQPRMKKGNGHEPKGPAAGPRPAFSAAEAGDLLGRLYGLEAESLRELTGERDKNFHALVRNGGEFVFKISNGLELKEFLDVENAVLDHLAEKGPGLGLPRLQRLASGEAMGRVRHDSGSDHFIRLLTYVPGRFLADVSPHCSRRTCCA